MKKLIFWLLLLLAGVGLNATPAEDYARTVSPPPATRPAPDPEASSAPARGFTNADQLKLLVNGALTLYQTFISSQNDELQFASGKVFVDGNVVGLKDAITKLQMQVDGKALLLLLRTSLC